MAVKRGQFILFVGAVLVLTVLLSISFVNSTVVFVNPLNGTSGSNISKTNVFFNVTVINSTAGIANPLNVTFYASPNGNGTWLLIGNSSTSCVPVVDTGAYNMSCGILLNITNSNITDGNYTINATVANASGYMVATMGNVTNMSVSVTIDGTAPAVVANMTPLTGSNFSNATTGAYTINVSVIDALVNLGSVRINITNASSDQVALLTATNASAGASVSNRYYNATWNVTAFNDGLYNLTIYANDSLGNMNSSVRIQVRVDSVAPNVATANFTSVAIGQNITGTFVFNLSVSDLNTSIRSVMLNITNSTGAQNSTVFATLETGTRWVASVVTTGYPDGSYNITAYVNDTAGNQNNTAVVDRVIFDNTNPNVVAANITSVGTGHNITGTYLFNFSVSDLTTNIRSVMINITNTTNSTTVFASLLSGTRWNASINTASFAGGSYNVSIVVNDTAGNQNSTNTLDLRFDNSAPAVSLSCTPNPVEQGDTITCTCSASDPHSGIRSTGVASTTDTASSGPHEPTCSATNMVNITGSASYTYTVSGGSGGSGGSSGGGSSGTTGAGASTGKVQRTFDSISAGSSKTISGLDSSYAIKSLEITVNNKVQDVKVTINKFDGKPASVTIAKTGKVYKYLEISASNVEGKVSSAVITTVLSKKWVSDNQLSKDKVALFRLVNNAWVELPTTITEEGDNYVLASTSPGFSFFSIAEKTTPAQDEAAAVAAENGAGAVPAGDKSQSSASSMKWWIIGVIVILVLVLIGYFVRKKK